MNLIDRDKLLGDLINRLPKMAAITEAALPVLICEQPVIKAAPITRDQVGKMRGKWIDARYSSKDVPKCQCPICGKKYIGMETDFCQYCGAPMTDRAVNILWKRLEVMQGDSSQD